MADQWIYSKEEVWEDFNQKFQRNQSVKPAMKPDISEKPTYYNPPQRVSLVGVTLEMFNVQNDLNSEILRCFPSYKNWFRENDAIFYQKTIHFAITITICAIAII